MSSKSQKLLTLDDLSEKIRAYNPKFDGSLLRKAYFFSHEAHCSQKRSEGSPYIGHPLEVASILAEMKMDTTSIIAGLLHDTIEDTDTKTDDIKALFGDDTAFIVHALTKLSRIQAMSKEQFNAENFRKMFLAMAEDIRVVLIKFADRLHNMRTLQHLPPSKQQRIAQETLEVYAPLANRLGIGWIRTEFEDLGFKYLYPDIYSNLLSKVSLKREEQEGYIKDVADKVRKRLKKDGIPGEVKGRVKHLYGIYRKMQAQGIPFEQIYDLLGIRIITETKSHCYGIIGILHSIWTPIHGKFKDYIALPKSNLYQSLHTTVIGPEGERIEFQVRTRDMNRVAEDGIAAHWMYKEGGMVLEKDARYIKWLREIVQSQKQHGDAREFYEGVKGEVVSDVVYVFTPAGDIKELPSGSTPVDFAYSIHTEVGHRCAGAKVNRRIVPLRYKLQSGDTVDIITNPLHGPSRDWLNFVVTQRAKARVKHWVKTKEREQSLGIGYSLIESEFRKRGLSPKLIKSPEMDEVSRSFSMKTYEDLLISVGYGKVSPLQVANKFQPDRVVEEELPVRRKGAVVTEVKGVTIKGIDHLLYNIAQCCYPVPGDQLAGFVTRGKGVTIHRRDCSNLERLAVDDSRLVDVDWVSDENLTFNTKLYVETLDHPGILASLSALISALDVNIAHFDGTSTRDSKARLTFLLEVKNKSQVLELIQKISASEGVLGVRR